MGEKGWRVGEKLKKLASRDSSRACMHTKQQLVSGRSSKHAPPKCVVGVSRSGEGS